LRTSSGKLSRARTRLSYLDGTLTGQPVTSAK